MNSIAYSGNLINNHMDNVIHGLRSPIAIRGKPSERWTLSERMEYYNVPGVSLAIIDNGKIVWIAGLALRKQEPVI